MIKLKDVKIQQYKSIEFPAEMTLDDGVTGLVGKNEAGKTNVLEAMAKANYYDQENPAFRYAPVTDYPRPRKKELEQFGQPPQAVQFTYQVDGELAKAIQEEMLLEPESLTFTRVVDYEGRHQIISNGFDYNPYAFWDSYAEKKESALSRYKKLLASLRTWEDYDNFRSRQVKNAGPEEKAALSRVERFFKNPHGWLNPLNEYVYRNYLLPGIPKFLYYDEGCRIHSRIPLDLLTVQKGLTQEERLDKAFLLLLDLDASRVSGLDSFEDYKSELETAQIRLNEELLTCWTGNAHLRLEFEILREPRAQSQEKRKRGLFHRRKEPEEVRLWLEIRVKDTLSGVSLPLEQRSRGFQWFFSFWVWFEAIRRFEKGSYILLLDEPGTHLHEEGQQDLMRYLHSLSGNYQIVYTTHSPFMQNSGKERIYYVENESRGTVLRERPEPGISIQ